MKVGGKNLFLQKNLNIIFHILMDNDEITKNK